MAFDFPASPTNGQVFTPVAGTSYTYNGYAWDLQGSGGGGGGAPVDAAYVTSSANATLSAERVLIDTASVIWDFSTAGQAKANVGIGGGGGNVSNSGTPAADDVAQWVDATHVKGVLLTTWRTTPTFYGLTKIRTADLVGGLDINPFAGSTLVGPAGTGADLGLALSSKGNASITMYVSGFAAICAQFNAASGTNTFPTFTGGVGSSTLANNPPGNPLTIGSVANLTAASTVPTPTAGDSSTKIATTAFVAAAVSGGGAKESFYAHKASANQTDIIGGVRKVVFPGETLDVGSKYDTSQSRWTPSAGAVIVHVQVAFQTSGLTVGGTINLYIMKNGGVLWRDVGVVSSSTAGYQGVGVSVMDQANGTDYYEAWASCSTATAGVISGSMTDSWFYGYKL